MFHNAAAIGNIILLAECLAAGQNINEVDASECTALMLSRNRNTFFFWLVNRGADWVCKDEDASVQIRLHGGGALVDQEWDGR
jgi:hypothetical protein